jgi:hypothetical protein|tara:strand:- start:842 stop:1063 length:222 start_codon:yes stop_codon:yes gene_type:complete
MENTQVTEEQVKSETPSDFVKIYRRLCNDEIVGYRVWFCPSPSTYTVNLFCDQLSQAARLKFSLVNDVSYIIN